MRKLGLAAALVLMSVSMGACTELALIQRSVAAVQNVVVSKDGVVIAVSTFHAVERVATNYLEQKKCPRGIQRPTCRSPAITEKIATAITEGQRARDNLLDFAEGHPGTLGTQGWFDALRATTSTLKGIFKAYNIGPKAVQS